MRRHVAMQMLRATLLALLGSAIAATVADAQSSRTVLVATVGERGTNALLEGADVIIPELRRVVRTNALGEAVIPLVPRGDFRVRVRRLGHVPAEVVLRFSGDTVGAVFLLDRQASVMDTVYVTASAVPLGVPPAFVARQQLGIGRFLVAEDLEREGDRDFMTVAMFRFPGLFASGGSLTTRRGGYPCPVRVLLDDIDVTEDVGFLVRTWDLAGAEFYSAASTPVQYRDTRAGCGVLLLWTKR